MTVCESHCVWESLCESHCKAIHLYITFVYYTTFVNSLIQQTIKSQQQSYTISAWDEQEICSWSFDIQLMLRIWCSGHLYSVDPPISPPAYTVTIWLLVAVFNVNPLRRWISHTPKRLVSSGTSFVCDEICSAVSSFRRLKWWPFHHLKFKVPYSHNMSRFHSHFCNNYETELQYKCMPTLI